MGDTIFYVFFSLSLCLVLPAELESKRELEAERISPLMLIYFIKQCKDKSEFFFTKQAKM